MVGKITHQAANIVIGGIIFMARGLGSYLLAGLIGGIIALWLEGFKKPLLIMQCGEEANDDNTYPPRHARAGERWKFFRIAVSNRKVKFPFHWITRETAQNCMAQVTFFKLGHKKPLFSMKGRWASTPEIPFTGLLAQMKTFYPDPVTIPANTPSEFLDIIAQMDGEGCAYAWNAESYMYNWRHPHRKLNPGRYKINVSIGTQNGVSFGRNFTVIVSKDLEKTCIIDDRTKN